MKMELRLIFQMCSSPVSMVIVIVTGILLLVYSKRKCPQGLPPGPRGYPIIGNMLDLSPSNIMENFRKFREEFGDLFSIHMGANLTVVVNGYENLKELFTKKGDAVSDRPPLFLFKDLFKETGVASCSGYRWKIHRAFVWKALQSPGFGQNTIESDITEEVTIFLNEIERNDGMRFNLNEITKMCIANIACSIAFGQRFDHRDTKFKTFLSLIDDVFKYAGISGPISIFPVLKHLPGDPFAGKRLLKYTGKMWNFIEDIIEEHRQTFDAENIRDYIDAYLKEKTRLDIPQKERDTFTDEQLSGTVVELFMAGTDTTAILLKWSVLYLLHNPGVQMKMSKEIEAVVGKCRLPSLNDKANLPFCEAVITEVMRCANVSPLSTMHASSEDINIKGFTIPKGSILIQNLDSVMKDPELFPDPGEFLPERFIDNNGGFGNHEKVIPFSIGRRKCVAESLARAEIFLFLTSLVQRFKILPVKGKPMPSLRGSLGLFFMPQPFDFVPEKRY